MSTDLTSIGKQLAADDKASVATVCQEDGIKPYGVPAEAVAAAEAALATDATEADSIEDPTFKEHTKKSLVIQDVMLTLANTERAAGLALVTLSCLSNDSILKTYLKDKPDVIKTLNDAQYAVNDFLTFVHNQSVDATIQWQPHMEFVLRTLQKCAEENDKKKSEAAAKPSAASE
jgi:hypothetical protein